MALQLFSNDLGVDLGTSNVLIYMDGSGVVTREPSVVALDKNSGKILQTGAAARNMMGRTPGNLLAMHPLKDGVVSDFDMAVKLLQKLHARGIPAHAVIVGETKKGKEAFKEEVREALRAAGEDLALSQRRDAHEHAKAHQQCNNLLHGNPPY